MGEDPLKAVVARVRQLAPGEDRMSLEDADMVTLSYGDAVNFLLSQSFFYSDLLPFVERGGIAVIATSRAAPIETWLGDPNLKVSWSGWEISKQRRSAEVTEGEWLVSPHDLRDLFSTAVTPSSAFRPSGDGWKVLASLRMADNEVLPYLMVRRIGKGAVVLTSSNFGYSGGYEIFGDRNTRNIVLLLENLHLNLDRL